jgi:hypothetical protein
VYKRQEDHNIKHQIANGVPAKFPLQLIYPVHIKRLRSL